MGNGAERSQARSARILGMVALGAGLIALALTTNVLLHLFASTSYDILAWLVQLLAIGGPVLGVIALVLASRHRTPSLVVAVMGLVVSCVLGGPALILSLFGLVDPHW